MLKLATATAPSITMAAIEAGLSSVLFCFLFIHIQVNVIFRCRQLAVKSTEITESF